MAANALPDGILRKGSLLLLLMVAIDAGFVGIHLVHTLTAALPDPRFSLGHDGGYAEIFQYAKLLTVVWLLLSVWRKAWQPVFGAWALLYTYLLGDDALQFHELGGAAIAETLGYSSRLGLRAVDFGELTISAAFGVLFTVAIVVSYWRSSAGARHASQDLSVLFAALVFFGVGFDMLHALAGIGVLGILFGLMEDGGELLAVSATMAYLLVLRSCGGTMVQPLWRRLMPASLTQWLKPAISSPSISELPPDGEHAMRAR